MTKMLKRFGAVVLALCIIGGGAWTYQELPARYEAGYEEGYAEGEKTAYQERYDEGYQKGASDQKAKDEDIWKVKVAEAREESYDNGRKAGYDEGKSDGYTSGYAEGKKDGYASGYAEGKASVKSTSSSSSSSRSTSNSTQTTSQTVYVTATGSKYHRSGCSYLRQSCYSISLNDAKAQGYTACSRCW